MRRFGFATKNPSNNVMVPIGRSKSSYFVQALFLKWRFAGSEFHDARLRDLLPECVFHIHKYGHVHGLKERLSSLVNPVVEIAPRAFINQLVQILFRGTFCGVLVFIAFRQGIYCS